MVNFAIMFRSLSIVHAAAIFGRVSASAAGCYPNYASGKSYAIGEWTSASVTVLTSDFRTKGEFSTSDVYNFQCISDDDMCSNDGYAPGSINSELAWTRDSTPCSVNPKEHDVLMTDVESSADVGSTSDTKSISRRLQVTTPGPSTSQPTSPTNTPTAVPTPTTTNTSQPTSLPTSSKPTLLTNGPANTPQPTPLSTSQKPTTSISNVPTSTGTPQPTANSTTALPTPEQIQTSSPTPRGATPIPIPIQTPKPTPIPTSAKPFRPTRKPIMVIPRLPKQCLCPCSTGSKASKQAKYSKSAATKAGKTWAGRIYCTCPCTPVVVKPTCYRCRTHIGRIN